MRIVGTPDRRQPRAGAGTASDRVPDRAPLSAITTTPRALSFSTVHRGGARDALSKSSQNAFCGQPFAAGASIPPSTGGVDPSGLPATSASRFASHPTRATHASATRAVPSTGEDSHESRPGVTWPVAVRVSGTFLVAAWRYRSPDAGALRHDRSRLRTNPSRGSAPRRAHSSRAV